MSVEGWRVWGLNREKVMTWNGSEGGYNEALKIWERWVRL